MVCSVRFPSRSEKKRLAPPAKKTPKSLAPKAIVGCEMKSRDNRDWNSPSSKVIGSARPRRALESSSACVVDIRSRGGMIEASTPTSISGAGTPARTSGSSIT